MEQTIETNRLSLRPWQESDAERLYELAKEPSIGLAAGWPPHTDVEMSRKVIKDLFQPSEAYAIVLKESGEIIGCIGAGGDERCPIEKDEGLLGYWVGMDYQVLGYTTEAARKLIDTVFGNPDVRGMWCGNFPENHASARVQEKLGFQNPQLDVASNWGMDNDLRKVVNRYLPNPNFKV